VNEILRSLVSTRFEKILIPIEDRLRLKLDEVRQETDHAPTIGAKLETAVRETLRQFLPSSFGVGHGFVYDAYGDGSKQTDLIITNPDNPLSMTRRERTSSMVSRPPAK